MSLISLSVTLPYPPSANRMWRHVGAKVLRSAEYERWRSASAAIIQAETKGKFLAGSYAMALTIGRPDRRRRDIDNLIKPVGDVLVLARAVEDDCECQRLSAGWSDKVEGVHVHLIETKRVEPRSKPITLSQTAARSGCAGDGSGAAPSLPDLGT